jgi:hypothetical protein
MLLSSLMLSADSLIVTFALSNFLSVRHKIALVVLFGCCDACASFIGPRLGLAIPAFGLIQSTLLILWGGVIALNRPIIAKTRRSLIWPYLLPPFLVIDNLVVPNATPFYAGLASSAMAALGFALGSVLRRQRTLREPEFRWIGFVLVIAGITPAL